MNNLSSVEIGGGEAVPRRRPGETELQYQRRMCTWLASHQQLTVIRQPGLGLPPPSQRFDPGKTGVRLGDWKPGGDSTLPPPDVTIPPGEGGPPMYHILPFPYPMPERPGVIAEPGPLPVQPAPVFFAPGGAVPAGLRKPRDPTAAEALRSRILAACRFDTLWGTPPSAGNGVKWNASRYLYEGTRATAMPSGGPSDYGVAYEVATRDGHYKQAYKDTQFDQWRVRWIETLTRAPDPAYPYRIMSDTEGQMLEMQIGQMVIGWADRQRWLSQIGK